MHKYAAEYRSTTVAKKGFAAERRQLIEEMLATEHLITRLMIAERGGNPEAEAERLNLEEKHRGLENRLDQITRPNYRPVYVKVSDRAPTGGSST